jgi:hypothetical protein
MPDDAVGADYCVRTIDPGDGEGHRMSTTRVSGPRARDRPRTSFRVVGLVLLVMALGLLGVGLKDFFSSLSSESKEAADQIWMAFVGLLLLGPAGWCLQAGFMGSTSATAGLPCGRCGTRNDGAARACDSCGAVLAG